MPGVCTALRDAGLMLAVNRNPVAPACISDLAAQTVSVDQHGTPRPQGANCDLGAIEADYIFVDGFGG